MIAEVFVAIRTLLLADSAIHAAVGDKIFADLAPTKAVTPYLIISLQAGRTDSLTMGYDADLGDINVKAVCDVDKDGAEVVTTLAGHIRRVLHREHLTIPGWVFYQMKHRTPFSYTDLVDRRPYAYAGAIYRVEADQAIT
jgi:hypothetical protein